MDTFEDWVSEAKESMAPREEKYFEEWKKDNPDGTREEFLEDMIEALQAHHEKWREI